MAFLTGDWACRTIETADTVLEMHTPSAFPQHTHYLMRKLGFLYLFLVFHIILI